ncbi:hypothetical protein K3D50_RS24260 [Escherichia coli]
MTLPQLMDEKVKKQGWVIVSCHFVQAAPMDDPEMITAMADCFSEQDGSKCYRQGTEIIVTSLSGYTGDHTPYLDLVRRLSKKGCRVITDKPPALAAAMEPGL